METSVSKFPNTFQHILKPDATLNKAGLPLIKQHYDYVNNWENTEFTRSTAVENVAAETPLNAELDNIAPIPTSDAPPIFYAS